MDEKVGERRRSKGEARAEMPPVLPPRDRPTGELPAPDQVEPHVRERVEPNTPEQTPGAPPREKGRRKRSVVSFLIGLMILFGLGYATYRVLVPAPQPSTKGGSAGGAPQSVGVAPVVTGDIRIIFDGLGTVTPITSVTVRTQINGQLTDVGFTEGQMVKKGDFLAEIDPRPYQLLEQQYEGQLAHDQGLLDQAHMDLARYQSLVTQNSIARQQAEDQAYIVKQYEGSVKIDQAQIDQQKLNLIYCHIVSPVTGRVGIRLVDPGNYVQTSDTTGIAVITELQPMSVIFSLPEDDIPEVTAQTNAGVTLTATAYDRTNLTKLATGKVTVLDNMIDTTTGMVRFRAEFANTDNALFPNQFVNVRVLIRTLKGVAIVPNAAIQRGAPGTYVYIVNPGNRVSVRPVSIGPIDKGMTQIVSGLKPGDLVVTDGTDRLSEGARIIPRGTKSGSGAPNGQHGHSHPQNAQ